MIFVDEDLCNGCGLCIDACKQGAVSVQAGVAMVDAELCTSCNRCAAVCLTGAIRTAEIVPAVPAPAAAAPALSSQPSQAPAGRPSASTLLFSPSADPLRTGISPAPAPQTPSRLALAEKMLSALAGLLAFAIERRERTTRSAGGCGDRAAGRGARGAGHGRRGGSGKGRRRRRHEDRCHAGGRMDT